MNTYKTLFALAGVLSSVVAFGQPTPPATPIDGGMSLLLLAGGAYGLKKLSDSRKAR